MKKELISVLNNINKKFGQNAVTIGAGESLEIKRIPTGSIALDIALGGGIPIGRYTQISGAFSSSKTTQALHVLREAQKMGLVCALIDAEGTTDDEYLNQLGINTDELVYCRPEGLEEATEILVQLQSSGEVQFAILDSIGALEPTKVLESRMDETNQMGIKPKLLGEYFNKFQAHNNKLNRTGKTPFTLIAINQLREKIGSYGDPEYTPGGRAKDFSASVDIRLRRGDWVAEGTGDNKELVGQVVKFKIEKNKTYKRMQTGEFEFYYAENDLGIPVGYNDNEKSIIKEAVAWGLITRGGAWYYLDKEKKEKFQGIDPLIDFLKKNPDRIEKLKTEILELAKGTN